MLVKDRMTPEPVCGYPDMPVTEAQSLMRERRIRHLPILDEQKRLVGLVTQRSLLSALPSDVSRFSQFEIGYVLSRVKVHHVMVRDMVTIDEDTPLEGAARVMADKKIGCLPVVRGEALVGIITDSDLFTIMVDLLGARRPGVRVTVILPDRPGEVARISSAIAARQGNLSVSVAYPTEKSDIYGFLFKVDNLSKEQVLEILNGLQDVQIENIREV